MALAAAVHSSGLAYNTVLMCISDAFGHERRLIKFPTMHLAHLPSASPWSVYGVYFRCLKDPPLHRQVWPSPKILM